MAKISTKQAHKDKAALLKRMREDAGLRQVELAQRIGLSRYTISAIENCHEQQISTIEADIEDKWWQVCKPGATVETKESWFQYVVKKLGF